MAAIEDQRLVPPQGAAKTNLLEVLRSLFRWKKVVLTACLIAALGSVVIVLLLPVYYQSTTIFFAASPDQSVPERLFGGGATAPEYYGNENDIDRLLTISESNELIDFLVDSFKLYEHYGIDPDGPKSRYNVHKHFKGLYDVTKTKRDAIELSMEDQDPELAAAIAKAARNQINILGQSMVKEGQNRTITTFEDNINAKETQIRVLSDTLQSLRQRYGIFNTEAQSESLTGQASVTESRLTNQQAKLKAFSESNVRGYRDSVAVYAVKVAGLEEEMTQLNSKLNRFNEGLSKVLLYTRQYELANSSLGYDKEKLKQYQATATADIPAVILVEDAAVPSVKSRPFRTLIVLASILVTFIFTVVGILIFEANKHIDWRSIYESK
jgi:uncharacterized protein involved in exopolysaccharide biosynthesis